MKYIACTLALAASGLSAQTLKTIQLDMAEARVGQSITATVGFTAAENPNCGLRVRWGDGAVTEEKIGKLSEVPYKASHTYAKPGTYQVVADPGKVKGSLGCVGKKVATAIKVVAPPPPPPPPAPAAAPAGTTMAKPLASGPSCPDGWKLDAKSVMKKTGAYSCTAKAGTPLPDKRLDCPGNLGYFENGKKGVLGCKA